MDVIGQSIERGKNSQAIKDACTQSKENGLWCEYFLNIHCILAIFYWIIYQINFIQFNPVQIDLPAAERICDQCGKMQPKARETMRQDIFLIRLGNKISAMISDNTPDEVMCSYSCFVRDLSLFII